MLNKEKYKIGYTVWYYEKVDMGRSIDYLDNEYKEFLEKHLGETTSKSLCTIKGYDNDKLILESHWKGFDKDDSIRQDIIATVDDVVLTDECLRDYNIKNILKE